MFRFIIISFEILALVAVLRSPFVHYLFGDAHQHVADWMLDLSLIAERKQLAEFRELIASGIQNLNDSQLEYLHDITSSKIRVVDFNRMYCEASDKNPYIYGATLQYTCSQIARSGVAKS
ncbi:hypothetical protein [Paraglaciecola hydrolytica]|uniref:Uncharacterized protein n=1 Tax=Paraglaciecola hydrolytica TaxID=1799789 RepID=A0A136A6T7_9ALTE|nr:hypothetical protein [Paraglaciecola hydrolytica]KXI30936.1 hypothetical protein AX660_00255 [Paraglaciecola hydrolytica]